MAAQYGSRPALHLSLKGLKRVREPGSVAPVSEGVDELEHVEAALGAAEAERAAVDGVYLDGRQPLAAVTHLLLPHHRARCMPHTRAEFLAFFLAYKHIHSS